MTTEVENTAEKNGAPALSMEYILAKIDEIMYETGYLHEAIDKIGMTATVESSLNAQHPAFACTQLVAAREKTHQELIGLLRHMFDAIVPRRDETTKEMVLNRLANMIGDLSSSSPDDGTMESIASIMKAIVEKVL